VAAASWQQVTKASGFQRPFSTSRGCQAWNFDDGCTAVVTGLLPTLPFDGLRTLVAAVEVVRQLQPTGFEGGAIRGGGHFERLDGRANQRPPDRCRGLPRLRNQCRAGYGRRPRRDRRPGDAVDFRQDTAPR